ncbi:MAG TPA: endonuclease/exonuclease/phosphatase family protein [Verrucomicrobiae bacterium]|nr:endonuclease/exonuclease/phosphatase family protein [Verrucomicrobiae bacterium]
MTDPVDLPCSPDGTVAEARALREAFRRHATLASLHADPAWPGLERRLSALLTPIRAWSPEQVRNGVRSGSRLRVGHWNLEHGNRFDAIARALETHPALVDTDLVTLNEVDLGMARSGNRDVARELASRLGLHAAWGALFHESTRGRDDDALTAAPSDNAESLFGLAILSRWPLANARLVPLPGPERLLFERERMTGRFVALVCEVAHPVRPFVAATVHLEVHRSRAHRAAQMRRVLESLDGESRPVVLTGDWNTHTFDRGEPHATVEAALALLAWPGRSLATRLIHPDRGRHREWVFDELSRAGFHWERYADRSPTLGLRFERLGEVHALPRPLRAIASRGLAWAERRAQLRLDWIAARGFLHDAGIGETITGLDGPGRASDHAPIVAELEFGAG